jgi:hypothetical protein
MEYIHMEYPLGLQGVLTLCRRLVKLYLETGSHRLVSGTPLVTYFSIISTLFLPIADNQVERLSDGEQLHYTEGSKKMYSLFDSQYFGTK